MMHRGEQPADPLDEALGALAGSLEAVAFALPGIGARAAARDRVIAAIGEHRARWRDRDAPLLAVLAGGTGAGKSTVLNTLVGRPVAATGVIRPTTASPTLVATRGEMGWFAGDRVLPGLARVEGPARGPAGTEEGLLLHLVASNALPAGLAVVDAPDVDSVRVAHRDLADGLLDAADVWVWLVTARTYADEAGMAYLRRAVRRRTAIGVVLTQAHERDTAEVRADLEAKLAAEGLAGATVAVIPFLAPDGGRLPSWAIGDLRAWLWRLARPQVAAALRRQTLDGALDDLRHEIEPLIGAGWRAADETDRLRGAAKAVYAALPERIDAALAEGLPLRQEILARWTALVGGQRFQQFVDSATGMVTGWVREALNRRTGAEQERVEREVRAEIGGVVAERVTETLDLVAADAADRWELEGAAGAALVAAHPDLRRAAPDLRDRAGREVVAWQEHVAELVRTKGAERKVRTRWLSTVVNAGATAAIVLAFATTGGLTGVEAGIAAGASAVNQWMLVRLLGEQNVRWLLRRVRDDLVERVERLGGDERARFEAVLEGLAPSAAELEAVAAALDRLDRERAA